MPKAEQASQRTPSARAVEDRKATWTAQRVTWAEVDLDALAANVRALKAWVGPRVELIAVVKANAYGHGAIPVARAALAAGASRLAVHRLEEGIALREAGIQAPILLLGYVPLAAAEAVVRYRLTPTVITKAFVEAVAAHTPTPHPIHIKVDTGMGRYGLLPHEVVDFVRGIASIPRIVMEGIYTHFATADEADTAYVERQFRTFRDVLAALAQAGYTFPLRHACNSAATLRFREAHLDAVRPGIALYGMAPSAEWPSPIPLQPVLTLKSRVARVRTLPPGSSIGYGRTFVTPRESRVALVPVGYGDGYHRLISNRGWVLIRGRRAPIRGRVSMDQIVVDVSDHPEVSLEDEVVLVGRQGAERITAEQVAEWAQTINYEVTTSLLPRVPRLYRWQGEWTVTGPDG